MSDSERAGQKYRPSNGSEGMWFQDKFCENCKHFKPDQPDACEINLNAMIYEKEDAEYPKEWVRDSNGNPTCTEFEKENQ